MSFEGPKVGEAGVPIDDPLQAQRTPGSIAEEPFSGAAWSATEEEEMYARVAVAPVVRCAKLAALSTFEGAARRVLWLLN